MRSCDPHNNDVITDKEPQPSGRRHMSYATKLNVTFLVHKTISNFFDKLSHFIGSLAPSAFKTFNTGLSDLEETI